MRRKVIIFIFSLLIAISFSSCNRLLDEKKIINSTGLSSNEETQVSVKIADIPEGNIISKSKHYQIAYVNDKYYYCIYDENGEIVKQDSCYREPHILLTDDQTVRFTLQAGTGISTQWGYYYDIKKDVLSRNFNCIYDQFDGRTALGDKKKVIVRDIFDKTKY